MRISTFAIFVCLLSSLCHLTVCDSDDETTTKVPKKKKLPKDPLFYSDVDLENLFDEWEDSDEEKLPPDELPLHKRPKTASPMAGGLPEHLMNDPDKLMAFAKKGQPLMAFVTVANNPTREEAEMLTQRWQVGLTNMHLKCERFMVADDRAIFMFQDGALAFEAKDYLTSQPELKDYTVENRVFHGKGYPVEYPNAPKKSDEL